MSLITPHGGLTEPVCCTIPKEEISDALAKTAGLKKLPVSDADLSTVYRFGDGGLSPLTGPMNSATYNRVLDESVIENNGKLYAWTIPLSLPVTSDLAAELSPNRATGGCCDVAENIYFAIAGGINLRIHAVK